MSGSQGSRRICLGEVWSARESGAWRPAGEVVLLSPIEPVSFGCRWGILFTLLQDQRRGQPEVDGLD